MAERKWTFSLLPLRLKRENFVFIVSTIIKLSLNESFMLFEQIIKFMIVLTSTVFSR